MTPAFFLGFQTCYPTLDSWDSCEAGRKLFEACSCTSSVARKFIFAMKNRCSPKKEERLRYKIQFKFGSTTQVGSTQQEHWPPVTPLWPPWLLYHANPSRFPGHQSTAPKMQPFANANDFPTHVLCNLHRRGPSLWHRAQEESCWVCIVLSARWCFKRLSQDKECLYSL